MQNAGSFRRQLSILTSLSVLAIGLPMATSAAQRVGTFRVTDEGMAAAEAGAICSYADGKLRSLKVRSPEVKKRPGVSGQQVGWRPFLQRRSQDGWKTVRKWPFEHEDLREEITNSSFKSFSDRFLTFNNLGAGTFRGGFFVQWFDRATAEVEGQKKYIMKHHHGSPTAGYCPNPRNVPPAPTAPTAPADLNASATSPSVVNLTWVDTSDNETGFNIERSVEGGAFSLLGIIAGADTTTFSDETVSENASYSYRINAFNDEGVSPFSNTVTVTTGISVPNAPTGLAVSAPSMTQLDLSWADNSTNESGFIVERSADGTTFLEVARPGANTTSWSNSGLSQSTTYHYRVRSYNSAGASVSSNTVSGRTKDPAPVTHYDCPSTGGGAGHYVPRDRYWSNDFTAKGRVITGGWLSLGANNDGGDHRAKIGIYTGAGRAGPLGEVVIPVTGYDGESFTFSTPIQVTPGQQLWVAATGVGDFTAYDSPAGCFHGRVVGTE